MHKKIIATYSECYFSPRKFEAVQNPHLSEFCILYTVPSLVLMNMQVVTQYTQAKLLAHMKNFQAFLKGAPKKLLGNFNA
jgi:hypothetical protein